MEEDKRSIWSKSLLLRVVTYSIVTSVEAGGFAAWAWRHDLGLSTFVNLALLACITFLLSYYLLGGALWLCNALIEQLSRSPKKDEQ